MYFVSKGNIKKTPFRAWFYFRNGWSMYFAFIFAAINTLTVTYYLAIEKIPSLLVIFPTFTIYVLIVTILGIPILIAIGYVHFKKSPAYKSEATIGIESNPFVRRNLINSELNLKLNLKILELVIKLSSTEKISENDMNEIKKIRNELITFVNSRTIKNKLDLDYLKKLNDE